MNYYNRLECFQTKNKNQKKSGKIFLKGQFQTYKIPPSSLLIINDFNTNKPIIPFLIITDKPSYIF